MKTYKVPQIDLMVTRNAYDRAMLGGSDREPLGTDGANNPSGATETEDSLAGGFALPPASARPRVWWHWVGGNITKEGIEKDLTWMKRVGIGGLQNFDGASETPQVVKERLIYMTPPWQDAFRYATRRAEELGLEFAVASSPGWSETGGPWVKSQDGMKKVVWSETRVAGALSFSGKLPTPPSVAGPFQHIPMINAISSEEVPVARFYQDVVVLAYPTPRSLLADPHPVFITTNDPTVDAISLLDAESLEPVILPVATGRPAWVLYDYGVPQRFRAVSLTRPSKFSITAFIWAVEASNDGEHFHRVAELPSEYTVQHTTASFPEAVARYLRLMMTPVPSRIWFDFAANAPGVQPVAEFTEEASEVVLTSLRFFSGARVHRFEEKAGFAISPNYYALDSGVNGADEAVNPKDILNLTDKMSQDGTLNWASPAGDWTVLRLGYSLTGKTNHPANPEATGLEVDKLDKRAVKAYLDVYLGNFERTVGPEWIGKRGIRALLTDSIESRGQNWTPAFIGEFKARRHYDPTLWLPALTGIIIGDAARTDRFLWDFRKTLMELMSEAHYGQIAESAHARGLIYYSESLEGYPTMALGDDLDMRAPADVPMAAIWTNYKAAERDGILNHIVDMRGAASVAHVLGKNLVAVEALTSGYEPWAFSPATLRPVIDLAFALGINRPVIHTSVHQPVELKPGMTLGPFGQHFTRHDTWADLAAPWITYLSRSAYLLQQGTNAADVAWFYGEEGSLAGLYDAGAPGDLPEGYGYDFVNAWMLLCHLRAQQGYLISSGGARYRLLYLGGSSERMTLAVLRKVKSLSEQGVPIAGRRPLSSPSLADEGREEEYQRLVTQLWDTGPIIEAANPNAALEQLRIARDFIYSTLSPDSSVLFLHRALDEGELYFLTNRKSRSERIEARFRVTGRKPLLWHAETGKREAVSWRAENEHTIVPLDLDANQSVFVLFRKRTDQTAEEIPARRETILRHLDGKWSLTFEPERGAPTEARLTELGSWTRSQEPGIKYFSGIGTYRRTFTIEDLDTKVGERVLLDLGDVHELAEVTLNETQMGTAWHSPFRLDVTDALKAGSNTIEVRIANLWVNRLIGDKQRGATPVAFAATTTYKPDAPLRLSGLIGPVVLIRRLL